MSTFIQKRYLSIAPVNSGEGIYGYSNGLPQMIFNLGSTGLLQTDEIRLSFDLKIVANGSTNDNNTTPAQQLGVGYFNGAESVIGELELSSTNYGRSLERIDHYARMNASVNSALHSKSMYDSHLAHEQASVGVGITTSQELQGQINYDAQRFSSIGQLKAQGVMLRQADGRECSMRIVCGMFLAGQELSLDDLGGLTLRIKLAPNEAVLSDIAEQTGEAQKTAASGFHYEIISPRIIAGCVMESPEQVAMRMSNPNPSMNFLSYSSFYNNIISDNFQVVHKLNASAVISCFTNYIPTKYLNNYTQESNAQFNPNIQNLTFQKDGARVPLTYNILTDQDNTLTNDNDQPSTFPAILWHYLSSWGSPWDRMKSSINPLVSQIAKTNAEYGAFGSGVAYDSEWQGISGKVTNVGYAIESKLLDPDAGNNTTQTPYSAFTYYLCKNELVVDRGAGVMVLN
jgi:hypothetical protein